MPISLIFTYRGKGSHLSHLDRIPLTGDEDALLHWRSGLYVVHPWVLLCRLSLVEVTNKRTRNVRVRLVINTRWRALTCDNTGVCGFTRTAGWRA